MGKIISTPADLVNAVQDVAGRGRIVADHSAPNEVKVYVPVGRVQKTDDYLKLHCPFSMRCTVAPLYWQEHLFLWSTYYRQTMAKGVVTINTPSWPVRLLQKFFKA